MKFPFDPPEEWKPRPHPGRSSNLTEVEKELLDLFDVQDQKSDHAIKVGGIGAHLSLFLLAVTILINGPQMLKVVQGWLGAAPAALGVITEEGK